MWLSQGNINLEHREVYDWIWNLSKIRLDNYFENYYVFNALLYERINHPISVVSYNRQVTINPGKNRLIAEWFKGSKTIPAIVYHTPKELGWLENQDFVTHNIQDYNISLNSFDHEKKIMFVRNDWFNTDKDFKVKAKQFWADHMYKFGTIQWYQHNEMVYECRRSNTHVKTLVDLKHPMGIWESICYLSGLENYKKLDYFTLR